MAAGGAEEDQRILQRARRQHGGGQLLCMATHACRMPQSSQGGSHDVPLTVIQSIAGYCRSTNREWRQSTSSSQTNRVFGCFSSHGISGMPGRSSRYWNRCAVISSLFLLSLPHLPCSCVDLIVGNPSSRAAASAVWRQRTCTFAQLFLIIVRSRILALLLQDHWLWGTAHESQCDVLQLLGRADMDKIIRMQFSRMRPGVHIRTHRDQGQWAINAHRLHVPLAAPTGVDFLVRCSVGGSQRWKVSASPCQTSADWV